MLSPASLRVCCLAVMAPALTKADRQAGCLPVVLSDSFCVPKTPDTYNIKGRISENRLKCAYTCENNHSTSNKRKPFMHRACWRTQKSGTAFICRYRTVGNDSSKSLLYASRVRTQREARFKTWQSTKATTAYAGKIKLKYTMNKNTSNIRNMGLAKANTSLGLQSVKKMKRFSKENQSSGPINVMEDSLNFSDSADSPVQIEPLITDITNSESDVSPVDNAVSCVSNNGRTSAQGVLNTVTDTVNEKPVSEAVLENDSEPFLSSAGADVIEAMDTSNASVTLTDLLSSTFENFESSKNSPLTSVSTLPCPVLNTGASVADASAIDTEVTDIQESSVVLQPQVCDSVLETSQQSETAGLPVESDIIPLQPLISKTSHYIFDDSMGKLPLNSKNSGSPILSLLSILNSSNILTNSSSLSLLCDAPIKCPVITDSRFGSKHLIPVRQEKTVCCLPSSQELESIESMLMDKATTVSSACANSSRLLQKQLSAHIKKQMSSLVEHYQRKFQIPCQRPAKHVSSKSNKDLLDLKAELLQSEDVKNMSTAALVSLVRKLETSGSQSRILTPKTALSSNIPESSETTTLCFDPDDCADIKHTSGVLLSALRNVLKSSDPYMTDFSEEENESESDDEETDSETETTDNTSALWNYMTQRTKLGSRSTWLLARVHELEFRIKEYSERWNELVKAEGSVCFEEPASSLNSSSITESEETSYSAKQTFMKNFLLPLNGFLDCSDASHIAKSTTSDTLQLELEDDGMSNESETETCCRVRPLNIGAFRKRKLVFLPGLHCTNPKFPRMSTVSCMCNSQNSLAPCILCTGQYHSTQSVDPDSMALRDRVSILDSYFHPALSTEKDIPLCLHLENILKTEAKYYNVRPPSPEPNTESDVYHGIKPRYSDLRSHRKLSRYARSLSAKYRNKHHRNTKHLRKHKLVFGKWRRLHNKHTLRARNRFRRHSIASSGSSPDSPVHSPMSVFDDGLGYEKKRRDDSQFDIDDVIIPCNSKSGRLVEIQYKEIMIPRWRATEIEIPEYEMHGTEEDIAHISDSFLTKRHDILEVEEKEKNKRTALGLNKRARRNRCDSRADSSGANTPDPTSLYNNQDNVFQTPNFNISAGPSSPASPPATPNSGTVSDDSQPPFGNGSTSARSERKKVIQKRSTEESTCIRNTTIDFDELPPYEKQQFPVAEETYEELLIEADHYKEVYDMPSNTSSFPASPISSSSSTSTVEEDDEDDDDDITDPEWTVVKPMKNGPEQALVLKFAKR